MERNGFILLFVFGGSGMGRPEALDLAAAGRQRALDQTAPSAAPSLQRAVQRFGEGEQLHIPHGRRIAPAALAAAQHQRQTAADLRDPVRQPPGRVGGELLRKDQRVPGARIGRRPQTDQLFLQRASPGLFGGMGLQQTGDGGGRLAGLGAEQAADFGILSRELPEPPERPQPGQDPGPQGGAGGPQGGGQNYYDADYEVVDDDK